MDKRFLWKSEQQSRNDAVTAIRNSMTITNERKARRIRDIHRAFDLNEIKKSNALKALSTCIEIIDSSNARGMVGWLGYGKSNVLDRSINRPFETHSELASFYAESHEWNSASRILATLVLRCEQNLPLYHPFTITSLLDLAAACMENGENIKAVKFTSRARHRLYLYLDEQEQACLKMLSLDNSDSNDSCSSKNWDYLKHFGLDHLEMMRSFVTSMHSLMGRQFLKSLPKNHPVKLLSMCFVGDMFSSLATILCKKSNHNNSLDQRGVELFSEGITAWTMSATYYKKALKGWAESSNLYHSDLFAASHRLAHCLKQLRMTDKALHVLSASLSLFLETARKTPFNRFGEYSTLEPNSKKAIIHCIWQLAVYTADYNLNDMGCLNALELIQIAIDFLMTAFEEPDDNLLNCLNEELHNLVNGKYRKVSI
jgi:hypothetical protein